MKATFYESTVFALCKSGIYLLLALVIGLLCWTGYRLATLESYAEIHPDELSAPLSVALIEQPPLLTGTIQPSSPVLGPEWDDSLPFLSRKQLEVFIATLPTAQQDELLQNLEQLLKHPSLQKENPAQMLSAYLLLKKDRYEHPPEIWGLPARVVLPVLLALASLLLIFLLLCIVLLKVERNTR
ncbi:hypothetical protein P0Y35_01395 [Kiritimatiellaeota bacterium B1221]|nr:hypothetical protein [Kiritimatiellaeota bacterium B1221]